MVALEASVSVVLRLVIAVETLELMDVAAEAIVVDASPWGCEPELTVRGTVVVSLVMLAESVEVAAVMDVIVGEEVGGVVELECVSSDPEDPDSLTSEALCVPLPVVVVGVEMVTVSSKVVGSMLVTVDGQFRNGGGAVHPTGRMVFS